MATSSEILGGFIAFVAFTIFDVMIYFASEAFLSPMIEIIDRTPLHPMLNFGDVSYVVPAIWAFLLICEIMAIVAFVFILGRRGTGEWEYGL